MTPRTVSIRDLTPQLSRGPHNVVDFSVPGLPEAQVARMLATIGKNEQSLAVVFPEVGSGRRMLTVEEARAHLPEGQIVALVTSRELGSIAVSTGHSGDEDELTFAIAAAAAVLQYSWGWDESETLAVSVDAFRFRLAVGFSDDRTFTVSEVAV
jgi:hypothetical protein